MDAQGGVLIRRLFGLVEGGRGGDSENESRGPKILGALVIASRAITVSIVSGICAASSPTTPGLRMRCPRSTPSIRPEAGER